MPAILSAAARWPGAGKVTAEPGGNSFDAWIAKEPRYFVDQLRVSIRFAPIAMSAAQGWARVSASFTS